MSPRALIVVLLLASTACESSACNRSQEGSDPADELFANDAVHSFALTLDRSAMAELAREPRDWVRGSLHFRGRAHADVGVRFKGHRSFRGWADKPALKLDFDKYAKGRTIAGLKGLLLNNMVEDPTALHEQLGSRVYAALKVPAQRTSFAELTINGERFGLYAVLEPVDAPFLARHFARDSGPLYEGEYGCDLYEGDVWGFAYHRGQDEQREHLLALARALEAAPGTWLLGDAPLFDRQRSLSYLATSALMGDFDGYRHAHNYRLYRDPGTELWSFIPWGFDRILKKRLSIYDSHGRVARRCFEDRACRVEYMKALQHAADQFERLKLEEVVDALDARIRRYVARDPRRPHGKKKRAAALAELRRFIRERPAEIRRAAGCWDGTRELDRDGDGHGCMDCDDADPAIHPGAAEACDGKDNDCSGLVDDAPGCECASHVDGAATFALCDLPMSWWRAKAFCEARGETLARVDSEEMLKKLNAAAKDLQTTAWWVGLDDLEREGTYTWQDGTRPQRKLWDRGEPDPYACGQNCAALRKGRKSGLRDMHCATPAPFICRAPAESAASP